MALGPVQLLVVGYGEDAELQGRALDELHRLREQDIVRLIDLLVVHHKDEDGNVEKIEISDTPELAEYGAIAGALIGFGAAGEEGAEAGADGRRRARPQTAEMYDDAEVWVPRRLDPAGHDRRHRHARAPLGDPAARRDRGRRRRGARGRVDPSRRTCVRYGAEVGWRSSRPAETPSSADVEAAKGRGAGGAPPLRSFFVRRNP